MKFAKKTHKLAACLTAAALTAGMLMPAQASFLAFADDEAFTDGSDGTFYYAKYSDHVVITGYSNDSSSFTIPSTVEGVPVTEIGTGAFSCSQLSSITIPDSVTVIGEGAFSFCSDLKSFTVPDSIERIEMKAFEMSGLTDFALPSHTVTIATDVFAYTPWLEAQRKKDPLVILGDTLIDGATCTGAVEIPSHVKNVAHGAFQGSSVTSVVFPAGVKEVGDSMFFYCEDLASVEMKGVETIGSCAFAGCNKLTDVKISGKLQLIEPMAFDENTAQGTITFYGSEETWKKVDVQDETEYLQKAKYIFDTSHTEEPDETVIGDVDADGSLTVLDVVTLLRWIHAVPNASLKDAAAADMDKNGVIDVLDLGHLKRALLK